MHRRNHIQKTKDKSEKTDDLHLFLSVVTLDFGNTVSWAQIRALKPTCQSSVPEKMPLCFSCMFVVVSSPLEKWSYHICLFRNLTNITSPFSVYTTLHVLVSFLIWKNTRTHHCKLNRILIQKKVPHYVHGRWVYVINAPAILRRLLINEELLPSQDCYPTTVFVAQHQPYVVNDGVIRRYIETKKGLYTVYPTNCTHIITLDTYVEFETIKIHYINNGIAHVLHMKSHPSTELISVTRAITQRIKTHREISNIRCTKSSNLKVCRLVLQLSLPNPMQPGVTSRMNM